MKAANMMKYETAMLFLFNLLPFNHGTYLPTLFWDTSNPILQKRYWHEVVNVKIFDFINFVCPNENIKLTGTEKPRTDSLYHNLYVKEVPAEIENFEGACDTSANSSAILIRKCEEPKKFTYQNIEINLNQADPNLPKFEYSKDYMFFATSDGTKDSLMKTSKNCTMVFRIHFSENKNQTTYPSCPLFDRKNVCEKPPLPKPPNPKPRDSDKNTKECKNMKPEELNTTVTTENKVIVTWQPPRNTSCNVTFYSVCYRENTTQPCQNVYAPASQHSVTLCGMAANQSYIIQVRAHTDEGPGDYCEKKNFKTREVIAQKEAQSSSFDGKSIAIGFVLGVFLTLAGVILLWFVFTRVYKKKVLGEKKDNSISKNNPTYCKGDDPTGDDPKGDTLQLNSGYRESGQNWKLPPLPEENTHLYVSDA